MQATNELRRYFAIVWHWLWLLLVVTALAGAVAYFVSGQQQAVYQASTTILIDEAPGTGSTSEYQSVLTSERRARTYAQLLTTEPLLAGVKDRLALPLSAAQLKAKVSVQSVRDTQLIKVQVRDTDAERAAQITNTLVEMFAADTQQRQAERYATSKKNLEGQMAALTAQISEAEANQAKLTNTAADKTERDRLGTALAQYRQSYANLLQTYEQIRLAEAQTRSSVAQVEPAVVPTSPISPRVLLNTVLAALVGLLVATGLVFLKETLDDTVKSPDELATATNLSVLGLIAHMHKDKKAQPIMVAQPRSPVAESFRALRTNLQFTGVDRPIRSILVTSPLPAEGKSEIAVNLSAVLAQGGNSVTLVDTDLRRPMLHNRLELSNRSGLSELFVQQETAFDDVVRTTHINGVRVITSGKVPPNPAELLASHRMSDIIEQLKRESDMVVLDTPPVMPVTDAAVLAQRVDGVVLVVRVGKTRMATVMQTIEQLRRVNANILGLVINDIPTGRSRYSYAYRGYYHKYEYGASAGKRRWFRRRKLAQSLD